MKHSGEMQQVEQQFWKYHLWSCGGSWYLLGGLWGQNHFHNGTKTLFAFWLKQIDGIGIMNFIKTGPSVHIFWAFCAKKCEVNIMNFCCIPKHEGYLKKELLGDCSSCKQTYLLFSLNTIFIWKNDYKQWLFRLGYMADIFLKMN